MTTTAPSTTPSKSGIRRANALPSGCMLDEYRIDSILGAGGFGVTYKAMDTHLDTWVAVKEYFPVEWSFRSPDGVTVHPNTQGDATEAKGEVSDYIWGLERFLDEARVLARIQHPYVVRVKRYFRAHGTAYIVMDFEEGEPLSAILQDGETLGEDQVRGLLEDVLPALRAVHEQGYLHRDIKPANLYVRASDHRVLLIDFGAAREAVGRHSKSVTSLVTPGYSPPEQYTTRNDRYGTWTDIYALGAVLYRCVVGHTPVEAAERLLEDSLEPASKICADRYSTNLLRVIDQALAVRPEQRFRTVADMQEALCGSQDEDSDETVIMAPLLPKLAKAQHGVETARITSSSSSPSKPAVEPEQTDGRDWVDLSQATISPTTRHRLSVLQGPSKSAHLSWRRFWVALIGSGLALGALAASLVWFWPSASGPGGQPPPNLTSRQDVPIKTPVAPPAPPLLQATTPAAVAPTAAPAALPPPAVKTPASPSDAPAIPPPSSAGTALPAPAAPPLVQGPKPPEAEAIAPPPATEPAVPLSAPSQTSTATSSSEPTEVVAEGSGSTPSAQTPVAGQPTEPLEGGGPETPAAAIVPPPAAVPPGPATAAPKTPAVSSPPPAAGWQPSPETKQSTGKSSTSGKSQERDRAAKNSQSAKSSSRYARQRSDRRRKSTPAVTTTPAAPVRAARPAASAPKRIEPWDKPTDSGFNQK